MQISLGRRGDYAVRAAVYLARHVEDEWSKSRDIAADMAIPENYLPQVLGDLIRVGVVRSLSGPHGGYALARPPSEVQLLEVIEAGGPVQSRECVLRGGPCRWEGTCAVHDSWSRAQEAMISELRRTTLADIARRDTELEGARSAAEQR
jgi:Rrf2 family transcriptional regulator, iron-sulfur cluster assembly transcription factor